MSSSNPFEVGAEADAPRASDDIVAVMSSTRPWVMVVAVMGALAATCLGCGGMFMGIAGLVAPDLDAADAAMMPGLGLAYVVFALIYAVPTWFLVQYARAIRRLTREPETAVLAHALWQQQRFWVSAGLMAMLLVAVYIVLVAVLAMTGIYNGIGRL